MAPEAGHQPFEGPEKRLDVCFAANDSASHFPTLRKLPREDIDTLLDAAACTVLSVTSDAEVDAYLLSESSLFVFDHRLIIKTCGTTTLLRALPLLLDMAASSGLHMSFLQYSRAAYLFPDLQPFPHDTFANEATFLDSVLGPKRAGVAMLVEPNAGSAERTRPSGEKNIQTVVADDISDQSSGEDGFENPHIASCLTQWHLYIADLTSSASTAELQSADSDSDISSELSSVTASTSDNIAVTSGTSKCAERQLLEIFMYDLDRSVMAQFFEDSSPASATAGLSTNNVTAENADGSTRRAGIHRLLRPDTIVDAHDFEPCGYSMNGLAPAGENASGADVMHSEARLPAYYTIHISPEPEASYVSFETSLATTELASLIARVVSLFRPSRFSAAFVGTGMCTALSASGDDAIDWQKLRKLLSRSFQVVGTAASLIISSNCVASFASFAAVSDTQNVVAPRRVVSSLGDCKCDDSIVMGKDGRVLIRRSSLGPCMSATVAALAADVGAQVMTSAAPVSSLEAAPLSPMTRRGNSDDSLSTSSSVLSVDSPGRGEAIGYRDGSQGGPNSVSREVIAEIVKDFGPFERPMFVVDLGVVERRILAARGILGSSVALRYAVHCNPDPAILAIMDTMGVEFEAASLDEVFLLRRAGVSDMSICFVSPIVTMRTVAELGFVRTVAVYSDRSLEAGVVENTRAKGLFGIMASRGIAAEVRVCPGEAKEALALCASATSQGCRVGTLGLDLAPDDASLPGSELQQLLEEGVRTIQAVLVSMPSSVACSVSVSLGEQYPGGRTASPLPLDTLQVGVHGALSRVTVDAGRYIVGPSVALITSVIGRRRRSGVVSKSFNYYLDDGVYGAFSSVLLEGDGDRALYPSFFSRKVAICFDQELHTEGTLFGPTCDALDRIWTGRLPELQVDDVVAFGCMGCYTISAASHFNGFAKKFDTKYVVSKSCVCI